MKKKSISNPAKADKRRHFIQKVIKGEFTIGQAARALGLSFRQVLRLKQKAAAEGLDDLIHGNTRRKPSNAASRTIKDYILDLKKTKYAKANFAHFKDLLEENEDISLYFS